MAPRSAKFQGWVITSAHIFFRHEYYDVILPTQDYLTMTGYNHKYSHFQRQEIIQPTSVSIQSYYRNDKPIAERQLAPFYYTKSRDQFHAAIKSINKELL